MCFLSSYDQLKFDLNRYQINMLKKGKWLILVYFLQNMSEIINTCFQNLYIIKSLGRSIKIMNKNYRFMFDIFKTIIYLEFCYIYSL